MQLRKDTYTRLTPVQRLQVARHPNRPTFLDIALNISDKFVELHGDRAGLDDPAMVCGLASIDGVSFMFIGHQKGRNTKVPIPSPLLHICTIVSAPTGTQGSLPIVPSSALCMLFMGLYRHLHRAANAQ